MSFNTRTSLVCKQIPSSVARMTCRRSAYWVRPTSTLPPPAGQRGKHALPRPLGQPRRPRHQWVLGTVRARVFPPAWRKEAGERRHKVDPSRVRHLACQRVCARNERGTALRVVCQSLSAPFCTFGTSRNGSYPLPCSSGSVSGGRAARTKPRRRWPPSPAQGTRPRTPNYNLPSRRALKPAHVHKVVRTSRAYAGAACVPSWYATVERRPCCEMTGLSPVLKSRKHPVP